MSIGSPVRTFALTSASWSLQHAGLAQLVARRPPSVPAAAWDQPFDERLEDLRLPLLARNDDGLACRYDRAVIHRVAEGRTCQDELVHESHLDRNRHSTVASGHAVEVRAGRTMEVDGSTHAHVQHGQHLWLPVGHETNMGNDSPVQYGMNGLSVIASTLGMPRRHVALGLGILGRVHLRSPILSRLGTSPQ